MSRGSGKPEVKLLWQVLSRQFWNIVVMNLMLIVLCLLVIPMPAALRAISRAEVELLRGNDTAPLRVFLKELRCEIVSTALAGHAMLLLTGACLLGLRFYLRSLQHNGLFSAALVLLLLITAAVAAVQLYLYPLLAFSDLPVKTRVRNAILMPFVQPLRSLALLALGAALAASGYILFPYSASAIVLILPALYWLIACWALWPGLCKYVFTEESSFEQQKE